MRRDRRRTAGRVTQAEGRLQARVLKALPWPPTGAQARAVADKMFLDASVRAAEGPEQAERALLLARDFDVVVAQDYPGVPLWRPTGAEALDLLYAVERTGRLEFPIKFATGATAPAKGNEPNFKKLVMLMEKDPSLKFRIETYFDPGMKPADERTMARERADALLGMLLGMGADQNRLTTASDAETAALTPGIVRFTAVDSLDVQGQ